MPDQRDHEQLADDLDRERADMEHQSEALKDKIDDARDTWRSRQKDPGVPGAEPEDEDDA